MSQPSTPLDDGRNDMCSVQQQQPQQQRLTQTELDAFFGADLPDEAVFSSDNSSTTDDFDIDFGNVENFSLESFLASSSSAPGYLTSQYGQEYEAHPPPNHASPQSYPLQNRSDFGTMSNNRGLANRHMPPLHSHTDGAYPNLNETPQGRRRSLSDSDANRLSGPSLVFNPTFVRLQGARSRSITPDEKRKSAPYARYVRSSSQGPGRPLKFTQALQVNPLAGSIHGTHIGTPLDNQLPGDSFNRTQYYRGGPQGGEVSRITMFDQPLVRHMMRPEDLMRSGRILEIGAMAITKSNRKDSQEPLSSVAIRKRTLAKVAEIEQYLAGTRGDNTAALQGCEAIRVVVSNEDELEKAASPEMLESPIQVFEDMDYDLSSNTNGGGDYLMALSTQGCTTVDNFEMLG